MVSCYSPSQYEKCRACCKRILTTIDDFTGESRARASETIFMQTVISNEVTIAVYFRQSLRKDS